MKKGVCSGRLCSFQDDNKKFSVEKVTTFWYLRFNSRDFPGFELVIEVASFASLTRSFKGSAFYTIPYVARNTNFSVNERRTMVEKHHRTVCV